MSTAAMELPQTEQLTGPQKVAILYSVLSPEKTDAISEKLSPEELEAVGFEVARMGRVRTEVVEGVLEEWVQTIRAAESLAEGGVDKAHEILERHFGPQRAMQLLKKINGQIADFAGLERLRRADPQQLGNTLRKEHPQTIALVLAHLDQGQTAAILKDLPPVDGGHVVYRMATMEKVSPEMLQLIESELGNEFAVNLTESMTASGGPAAVAAVLNMLNPSLEKELLETIATKDPVLCEHIKSLMFVFEDIVTLDVRSMQRLLREIDTRELALALKVASDDLKGVIFSAMTQRALAALKDEIEIMGPAKMRDIEAAQAKIVAQVRALEEAGEIVVATGEGDDVVVV